MARVEEYFPIMLKWEGGLSQRSEDRGGLTNMGVTERTWKKFGCDKDGDGDVDADDLRIVKKEDVLHLLKVNYWDKWQGDHIQNQSIANFLVDWYWNSGKWGIIIPQRALRVEADGVVGPITLACLNSANPEGLFDKLKCLRVAFIEDLIEEHPEQEVFRKGWMNRIESFKFVK